MLCNKRFWIFFLLLTTLVMLLTSCNAFADIDLFTTFDDPSTITKNFFGDAQVSYNAQSGNTHNSNLVVRTTISWFQKSNSYSIIGEAVNNSFDDQRNSEKYQVGARARHNLSTHNFLFIQGSWLSDRYNGYVSRDTLVAGYGRQVLMGPIHTLRIETGSGIRHNQYRDDYHVIDNVTEILGYTAISYNYQLTNNTKLVQGLSLLASEGIVVNSETGLNIDISDRFALKLTYKVIWNQNSLDNMLKHTDTKTSIALVYNYKR